MSSNGESMTYYFDKDGSELEELIEGSIQKAAQQTTASFKELHLSEAEFYSAVLKAKKAGVRSSESLLIEAEELFGKRDMLKISAEESSLMAKAATLLLDGLQKD